jgi:surfeit locus 1 family protein
MSRSNVLVLYCIRAGTAVLCALGTWQVPRLHWKEALIAEVDARRAAEPLSLADMERLWERTSDVEYRPVWVDGVFEHSAEQYYYNTYNGTVGWNVFTPLVLDTGRVIFVNRGFVPDNLRDPALRPQGQLAGRQKVTGLARNPVYEKPNSFMPDNEPARHQFYWKSLGEMAVAAKIEADTLVPFFVDAGDAKLPGTWPLGGTTRISFPNNHLQYAVTWFGLALALLGVGGFFLFSKRYRQRA